MIKDYFSLAIGNLRHRGLRSWLTMLGIFIGIAAVVSLITMGQGLEAAITGQFGTLSVDTLTIQNKGTGFGPPGSTVVEKLNNHDLEIIKSVNGIDKVVPRLIRVGSLEYNKISGFGYAADIPMEKDLANWIYESSGAKVAEGKLIYSEDKGKVLLGNYFLTTQEFEKPFMVGKQVLINGQPFEIAGILEKSSSFTLNTVVLVMHDDLQNLLEIKDEYDLIVVQVKDKNKIEDISQEIERKLRKDRNEKIGEETFSVETPLQTLSSVKDILNIVNLIVIGIAAISLFVGGVGIANTMYTSVVERTREIGIMKAIGGQNKDVLLIFLIEAGLLGLIGGIIGASIGISIALTVSLVAAQYLGENIFKITISYPLLIGAIAFSFFVGVISGILPAIQASKLKVVDAIRR
jgi:putative ABC transport system permease protein